MFHHYSLQGFFGWSFSEQLIQIGHKPPLYYGGLPVLLSGQDSLSYPPLLAVNALALAGLLWGCWKLGTRLGGPRAALFAVAVTAALPAVAGRATIVGVELLQLAALVWILEFLARLLGENPKASSAIQLGLLLGAAMLCKWTIAVPLVLPACLAAGLLLRAEARRRRFGLLVLAAGIAAALFALWLVPYADWSSFTSAAEGEASTAEELGYAPWLYLPGWALSQGLGLGLLPLVLLCVATWPGRHGPLNPRETGTALAWLLASSVVSVFLIHNFIPHKEPRYVLLAMPGLGVLLGVMLHTSTQARGIWLRRGGFAAIGILWLGTFVAPYTGDEGLPDAYSERPLHGRVVAVDYGLEQLVRHPTFGHPEGSVVSYSLGGERWLELRDLLSWELYARNDSPVLSRLPAMPTVNADEASRSLDLASHFITNRALEESETDVLNDRGFRRVFQQGLPLPDAEAIVVWSRDRNLAPLSDSLGTR